MSDSPPPRQSVLLLGSSRLEYVEDDPSGSMTGLLEAELNARVPSVEWVVDARGLFYGRRMREIAVRQWEREKPDFVVLVLGGVPFAADVPIARIRRRWPRFYPVARLVAERLKAAAGGGAVDSWRGRIYGLPRWLLLQAIGGEPEVDVEEAIASTIETLDALLRLEEPVVVCSFGFIPPPAEMRHQQPYLERIGQFKAKVKSYCREHHVAAHDRAQVLAALGREVGLARDRLYADRATRELDAERIASLIAAAAMQGQGDQSPRMSTKAVSSQ